MTETPADETTLEATRSGRTWWRWYRRTHPPDHSGGAVGGSAGQGGTSGSGGELGQGGSAGTGTGGVGGTIGGSAGATGGGTASDCDLCEKAQACCLVVSGVPRCQFSAATCSSMSGVTRDAYINACQVWLTTTAMAWNGQPPSVCR